MTPQPITTTKPLRMRLRRGLLVVMLTGASLVIMGCARSETPLTTTAPPATASGEGPRAIEVSSDDTMKFKVTEIRARRGEPLRLTLKNEGQLPRNVMAHNWVLLQPMSDSDVNAFGLKASSVAPEYLPGDRSLVIAHTKLIGPDESDTVVFNAPTTAGVYPYLCTFPGHFSIMQGKLIVE